MKKRIPIRAGQAAGVLSVLLAVSLGANVVLAAQSRRLEASLAAQHQREMNDVADAMAGIEINLAKLLIAAGARQSVELLGETALLAQHVESGLSRLPLGYDAAGGAMKFAGQIGDYAMTLAAQVSGGGMISGEDESRITGMLTACRALGAHLTSMGDRMYQGPLDEADVYGAGAWQEEALGGEEMTYPSLIYDGPFSDGRHEGRALGLGHERVTREQAREAAARYAGVTVDRVDDAADSGGTFEAFGFTARTDSGRINVQITGQGGQLLFMMPEEAAFAQRYTGEDCLRSAAVWLADMGFGQMEACFVQQYDGMIVANFAAVQDGVLLYPDQVKVQVSMESGTVVGAECSQYLANHTHRTALTPSVTQAEAREMISDRLTVTGARLCVIPREDTQSERLCWSFEGTFAGDEYWVFIDAAEGGMIDILRLEMTQQGETAV